MRSGALVVQRSVGERVLLTCGALAVTLAAWVAFSFYLPTHVLVGTHRMDAWAPVHYQAAVFPGFSVFAGAVLIDMVRRNWSLWLPRALLLVLLVAVATIRLRGWVPLSGHVLCCTAISVEGLTSRGRPETPWVLALAAVALAITSWYKLAVWADPGWYLVSVLVGSAMGWLCGRGSVLPGLQAGSTPP